MSIRHFKYNDHSKALYTNMIKTKKRAFYNNMQITMVRKKENINLEI